MNSTVGGITSGDTDVDKNADDSMRLRDDGLSNVTDRRDWQCAKQKELRIST
jgi:hypothetical protein